MTYHLLTKLFVLMPAILLAQQKLPSSLMKDLSRISSQKQIELAMLTVIPDDNQQQIGEGKFYKLDEFEQNSGLYYVYVGKVNSCRAGGCSISTLPDNNADHEYFEYYAIYDSKLVVQQVRVYNYQASHGQEISAGGWLRQFRGYSGNERLVVGKQIDAISGATISVHAITNDIEEKTKLLRQLISIQAKR